METFDTIITPVRRNVARKSTANRPLLNTIIKAPPKIVNKNHLLDESIVSKSNQNSFKSYPSYEPNDFNLYFDDDSKNTSKRSLIDTNKKKYLEYLESSGNSLFHEESEDEDLDLSGVFCVSDDMTKYLDEGNLSPPTNYDSSDESIDLSRVRNYPVKLEKCRNDQCFVSNKVNSPIKEPAIDAGKNIKQELFSEVNNEDNLQPVIVNHDSVISNDSSITELGTQTKKCLFDPNLESVTCKVKVREEVLVCENVPLKMTILEANFDVDHLENVVEDDNFKVDLVNEKDDNVTIIPQVICAMSLGSNEKSELCDATTNSQIPDEQKRNLRKTKKVLLKKEPSKTSDTKITKTSNVHEKRLTRSQMHVNNNTNNNNKRITRNSTRLNPDSLVAKESLNTEINGLRNSYENERFKNDLIDESQNLTNSSSNEETKIPSLSNENSDIPPDQNKEDKTDCRKKANLDKKGKKEINEGVLLHVEATKETELMRDGKIIKDKEEYLKDIESKIDKNLPVVVEKEFDIQQSLTEEILLDQALRLAHQRTSPRLSKIMKEAILKASVQKPCSKPKQSKSNCNKLEIKSKGNKIPVLNKNNSEEADLSDSVLNNSTASESNSDKTFSQSSESLNGDVDVDEYCETVENQKKKKKENYVISPVAKQTNAENTVEPLTIKICRKNNKKKTGFRLTSKKKRSPKKKEGVISKPVCSKDVNMDDLSKTFEDVLQDDNWCTDDKMNTADSENFKEENAELAGDKNSTNDQKEVLSINTSEQPTSNNSCISDSEVISEVSNVKKSACVNVENINTIDEKVNINADTERNIGNDEMSDLNNSKQHSIGDDSAVNDSSTPLSGGINNSISNSNSKDSVSISSHSKIVTDITSEKNSNLNLEYLPTNCNTDSFNTCVAIYNTLSSDESNKPPISSIPKADLNKDTSFTKPQPSSDIHPQLLNSQNDLLLKNSLSNGINKSLTNSKMFENQYDQVHQMINTADQIHNQINNDACTHQEPAMDILKCPLITPNTEIQPKVLPLSIASRDPRLRKSHVRVIVEVSTSSVSSSPGKSDIQQETRIISQVMQNVSKEIDCRKEAESDSETNENQIEMDRRKKFKKREVDAELLYKTPLSDLHDIPERTSYTRSIRKRSPPKIDKRDPRTVRRKENFLPNNDRVPETYREYHEINIYSKLTHQDSVRSEIVGSPSEFNRNDNFSPDYRAMGQYRPDSHHPEHYNSFRGDVDLRRRENYSQNSSTEYVNEVRHTKDFTERVYQNHSEHHRVGYQYKETEEEYRCSENYPPGFIPPDNYSRGYKRPSEFNSDHSHHGSPDFREKEHVRERIIERNHISHNEPSYSRWDYAHKKVEGHFPPEVHNEKEEKNLQPDEMKNMWQEERDLIDGPVKSFSRPYYRRKKFSRGEELFERRTTPWDIDNRRFTENERLWVRKTDQELIHGPDRDMRWDRRGRKGFRDVREERSRSPRRDHDRYNGKRSRSPGSFLRSRREASPSPHNSPLVLDSPMSPEPADRYCVLEPTKCLTVPQ
ncbi:putative leucine-rich repeat-containing protein DDB_G0290503 [Halyomorpha halys]|uniref:putative leucine-rich repeat-containing protein DDB_G0290503 n=1 Tax=Halyomorpha halys TaxID=286706 RepID=UPI0034D299F8